MFLSMFCEFLVSLTKTLSKRANQKSKKLSCKPFSRQARNGFSLLSGCRGDSFLFSHYRNALSARNSEKSVETSRICLFSLRKPLSVCKPGKSDKSEVANSVFSGHSSKAEKVNFLPSKICEELSARKSCPKSIVCQNRKVCLCRKKGQFLKDFSIQICLFFPFPTMPANDRGYGHLAVCGSVRCRETTK